MALTGLGLVGTAGTASAAGCGTVKDTTVKERRFFTVGASHYTMTCSRGGILVSGRVEDKKKNKHCIEAKIVGNGQERRFKVCDGQPAKNFSVRVVNAQNAEVYTYQI